MALKALGDKSNGTKRCVSFIFFTSILWETGASSCALVLLTDVCDNSVRLYFFLCLCGSFQLS